MQREAREPGTILLRCDACRATLPAAPNDVAFRCPQCGRAWEIDRGTLGERPSVHVVPPASAPRELLYLPYWSFPVSVDSAAPDSALRAVLTTRDGAQLERVYVAAYAVYRPAERGDWGLVYTRAQPLWETRGGGGPDARGACISAGDAQKLAWGHLVAALDSADYAELGLRLEMGEPELWAIPCYDAGAQVRCPWTHSELAASALYDLSEIRPAAEERRA